MNFNNPYWSEKTKIELLEKWILVHSFLYYEDNNSIVSDTMFDNNCKQLKELRRANRQAFKESKWFNAFKDYVLQESNSGYALIGKLNLKETAVIKEEAYRCKNIL